MHNSPFMNLLKFMSCRATDVLTRKVFTIFVMLLKHVTKTTKADRKSI